MFMDMDDLGGEITSRINREVGFGVTADTSHIKKEVLTEALDFAQKHQKLDVVINVIRQLL